MTCGCFPEIIPCLIHCITDWVSIKVSAWSCVLCKLIINRVLQSYSLQPDNNFFSSNSIGYRCTNIHNLHWLLQPAVSQTLCVWKMWDKLHKSQVCAMQTWYLFRHPYLKLTSWKGEPVFSLALNFDELLKLWADLHSLQRYQVQKHSRWHDCLQAPLDCQLCSRCS